LHPWTRLCKMVLPQELGNQRYLHLRVSCSCCLVRLQLWMVLTFPTNPLSKSSRSWIYMFMTSLHMIPPIGSAMRSTMAEISSPKCLLPLLSKQQSHCFWKRCSRCFTNPVLIPFDPHVYHILAHGYAKLVTHRTSGDGVLVSFPTHCPAVLAAAQH
jgi:hypothetical protein